MLADCLRDLGVGVVSLCGRCPCLSGDSLTRGPGARTYNGQGLPRRSLSNSYAQVKGDIGTSGQAVCKTVGLAYVGSNPTPATTHSPRSAWVTKIIRCVQGERSVTPSTRSGPQAHGRGGRVA